MVVCEICAIFVVRKQMVLIVGTYVRRGDNLAVVAPSFFPLRVLVFCGATMVPPQKTRLYYTPALSSYK